MTDLKETIEDMDRVMRACYGQYYYFKESLAAYDARVAVFQGNTEKIERALKRFDDLMRGVSAIKKKMRILWKIPRIQRGL